MRAGHFAQCTDEHRWLARLKRSVDELRHRLQKRGTESPEQIEFRLENAAAEMKCWREYKYTIISGSMEEDLTKFRAITRAERYLSRRIISLEG